MNLGQVKHFASINSIHTPRTLEGKFNYHPYFTGKEKEADKVTELGGSKHLDLNLGGLGPEFCVEKSKAVLIITSTDIRKNEMGMELLLNCKSFYQ